MPTTIRTLLSIIGVLVLIFGVALMVKGSLGPAPATEAERSAAPKSPIEQLTDLVRAVTGLLKVLDKYVGPNIQVRVGVLLVIVGGVLAFGPWFLPAAATNSS
jgi:uncharacterized membrane protein YczE